MRWWHDDMICNAWHASNDKETTTNNWRTAGTSVSGRYNTPSLREDLVPRSRMAPEGQRKRKRRGKTKLLLWQTSETKEPWEVEQIEGIMQQRRTKLKHSVWKERNWIRTWKEGTTLWLNGQSWKEHDLWQTRWWVEKINITMPPERKNRI